MRSALKFLLALAVTVCLMLCFRALFFTIYTVEGTAFEPVFTAGDHVLVSRWSYGLRTGGGRLFGYARWMASQPSRGDLVAFNVPLDTVSPVACHPVYLCFCKALPGDTVSVGDSRLQLPGRRHIIRVTADNMRFLSFLYNRYEGKKAAVKGNSLYIDGRITRCASFSKDYYWMSSARQRDCNDSRFFGPVPEDHLIGKAVMLLYSVDAARPFYDCLRAERSLLFIKSGASAKPRCASCD